MRANGRRRILLNVTGPAPRPCWSASSAGSHLPPAFCGPTADYSSLLSFRCYYNQEKCFWKGIAPAWLRLCRWFPLLIRYFDAAFTALPQMPDFHGWSLSRFRPGCVFLA